MIVGLDVRFVANSMMEMKHADMKRIVQHIKVCKSPSLEKESYYNRFPRVTIFTYLYISSDPMETNPQTKFECKIGCPYGWTCINGECVRGNFHPDEMLAQITLHKIFI